MQPGILCPSRIKEKFYAMADMLKRGRYKLLVNYLAKMKDMHIDQYGDWPLGPRGAARRYTKSALRDLGSSKQTDTHDLHKIKCLRHTWEPLVSGGPVTTIAMTEAASYFMIQLMARWQSEVVCGYFLLM